MKQIIIVLSVLFFLACENNTPLYPIDDIDTGTVIPSGESGMRIYQVDPLIKIVAENNQFTEEVDVLDAARGETASLQLIIKAEKSLTAASAELVSLTNESGDQLSGVKFGWVRDVLSTLEYYPKPSLGFTEIQSMSKKYPDVIIDDETEDINAGNHASLLVSIPIPNSAKPGLYTGKIKVNALDGTTPVSAEKTFSLRVYPVNVGEPELFVTNWVFFDRFHQLNNGEQVQRGTQLFNELRKKLAETCKSLGQNTYLIDARPYPIGVNPDGSWIFNFDTFDEDVQAFIDHGGLKRIEAGHILSVTGGAVGTRFGLNSAWELNENGGFSRISLYDDWREEGYKERVEPYFKNYFQALKKHLTEKGWLDMFVQHLGDEPTETNYDGYIFYAQLVKKYFPEIKLIDAMDVGSSSYLKDVCDIMVPKLDVLHQDDEVYRQRTAQGKENWFYTSMSPRGNYANRFVNLPLVLTRILHWINYYSGTKGYLHWGLMWWHSDLWKDLYQDSSNPRNFLPGGDSYLIYPGYHKFYMSIRANAMRDGIHDYNLLKMVERRSPEKAQEFLGAVVYGYDDYDIEIKNFRNVRREMLEFLSN